MDQLAKKIEIGANIAIILIAVLMGIVLVKNYVLNKPQQAEHIEASNQAKNTAISFPDVDWQENGQTLVLALSSTCHFCTESGPFYQQLVENQGKTRLLAVLPQSLDEGKRYLEGLGVNVSEIRQGSLSTINVTGTPTLLLVNSDGKVTDSWVGKLPVDQEKEVLSKLGELKGQ